MIETAKAPAPTSALLDVFHQIDIEPVRGEGVYLHDREGRRYLDFYGGHAVALLGYGHPRLINVLDRQARTLFFQSNLVDLEVRRRAAQALVGFGPAGLTRVFFVNSGAEANENALRLAFMATKKRRVVCVEGGFHGRTAAAAAVTDEHTKWYAFPEKPFPVTVVPFDDVRALDAAIDDEVAAVIIEPVQGIAGARPFTGEYLQAVRDLTKRRGAIFIADEVQCGMGRTGYPFAVQAFGITPDVLTTAKGLAGGFPVGALMVGEEMAKVVKKGDLGTTFGGGPLACALVEEVIAVIQQSDLLNRVQRLSERIRSECVVGPVKSIQGMGYLLGLRCKFPAKQMLVELRRKGILAGSSHDPDVVRLLPPLILEGEHVHRLRDALKEIGT